MNYTEPDKRITETVAVNEDGTIEIGYLIVEPGISPGHSLWTSGPNDADFLETKSRHGLSKPGQISTITKELRNGVWTETQTKEGDWS